MSEYRSRDVARLLGLPVAEVRRLARMGFLSPLRGERNELRFSFQDLVLLRAAAGLVHGSVPKARIRIALGRLRAQVPQDRPLAAVRVSADAGRVVAQDGGARWHADTGQVLLDLEDHELARRVAPVLSASARSRSHALLDAVAWYRWGRDMEAVAALAEAKDAYGRALSFDGRHAGAHLSLGRLLHYEGDPCAAELHYRLALESSEHRALAAFNLGAALEDQGLLDEALLAYARAIETEPRLADAHLKASRLLERLGRRAEALRLLSEYRRLSR